MDGLSPRPLPLQQAAMPEHARRRRLDPKVRRDLILDEAASALDPESEAIFIRNLAKIAVGRTVVMISHRLSTLVNAHAILVMQYGQLMDSGRHEELLQQDGLYAALWRRQSGGFIGVDLEDVEA